MAQNAHRWVGTTAAASQFQWQTQHFRHMCRLISFLCWTLTHTSTAKLVRSAPVMRSLASPCTLPFITLVTHKVYISASREWLFCCSLCVAFDWPWLWYSSDRMLFFALAFFAICCVLIAILVCVSLFIGINSDSINIAVRQQTNTMSQCEQVESSR